jgi:hypothetical protein
MRLAQLQRDQQDRLEYEQHEGDDENNGYVTDEHGRHVGFYEDMTGTLPSPESDEDGSGGWRPRMVDDEGNTIPPGSSSSGGA